MVWKVFWNFEMLQPATEEEFKGMKVHERLEGAGNAKQTLKLRLSVFHTVQVMQCALWIVVVVMFWSQDALPSWPSNVQAAKLQHPVVKILI